MRGEQQAWPQLRLVADAMLQLVDDGQFTGVAAEAWRDGVLIHRSGVGHGDIASGTPMRPDTIVRVYSMTKPVTAVAMMILHDQGLWKAEDPIAKFLPEFSGIEVFAGTDEDGRPTFQPAHVPPTMAHLLTGTAGFSHGFDPGWTDEQYRAVDPLKVSTSDDFVTRLARIPLAYQPGTRWRYSVSSDLQAAIVERLSGMKLHEFMTRYIFEPLGMPDTAFHVPPGSQSRVAEIYHWTDGALRPVDYYPLGKSPERPPSFASGGGGLFSTAMDYGRFARMLLDGGQLEGVRIISESGASTIMSSHLPEAVVRGNFGIGIQQIRPGYEYGYNGIVVTDPAAANVALGKGSYLWDGFASTWFWIDPEHRVVFVGMVQRVNDPTMPNAQAIAQSAVRDALFPPGTVTRKK